MNEPLTPVQPTEDMRLPEGSAVFQIILNKLEDGSPNLDMRGVLIGGPDGPASYDPTNPAHRLMAVIGNRIDELVAEATGGSAVRRTDAGVIERRLQDGEQPGAIPEEPGIVAGLDLSDEGLTRLEQQQQRHELTETEAVRQDKLAKLAAMYGGDNAQVALKLGPDGNPAEPQAGFEATGMEQVREQAPWPFGSGKRDPDFDIADRQEGKGGSGLHTDD